MGGACNDDDTAPQAGWEAAGAAFARAHGHIPLSARCERRDGGVVGRGHDAPALDQRFVYSR